MRGVNELLEHTVYRYMATTANDCTVNELLCFIVNKMSTMPADVIIKLVCKFYDEKERSRCCQGVPATYKERSRCCQGVPATYKERSRCCQGVPATYKERSRCCQGVPATYKERSRCCQGVPATYKDKVDNIL